MHCDKVMLFARATLLLKYLALPATHQASGLICLPDILNAASFLLSHWTKPAKLRWSIRTKSSAGMIPKQRLVVFEAHNAHLDCLLGRTKPLSFEAGQSSKA
jgi:hypothetical protein